MDRPIYLNDPGNGIQINTDARTGHIPNTDSQTTTRAAHGDHSGPGHPMPHHVDVRPDIRALAAQLAELITELRGIADIWARTLPSRPDSSHSPGPAKGLATQIRPTPDHRNPNARSNLGFAPVKAEVTK